MDKAAAIGDLPQLEQLLEDGWDVDGRDEFGFTPLLYTAKYGHSRCLQMLLKNGADITARSDNLVKSTALHVASLEGHSLCIETALIRAIENLEAKNAVWLLLNKGADSNLKDNNGRTALHRCAEVGNLEAVELLLDHQADVNSCDNAGDTPLNLSIIEGNKSVAKLLLEKGADATIANEDNKSGVDYIEENHRYSDIFPHINLGNFYDDLKTNWTDKGVPAVFLTFPSVRKLRGALWKLINGCENQGWKLIGKRYQNMVTFSVNNEETVHAIIVDASSKDNSGPFTTPCLKIQAFHLQHEDIRNTSDLFKYLPLILRTITQVLELHEREVYVNPCGEIPRSDECLINHSGFYEKDTGEYRMALCPVHRKVLVAKYITPWFEVCHNRIHTAGYQDTPNGNEIDTYLHKVSKLVTDEVVLFDIGIQLNLSADAITIIREDNPRSIVNAGFKMFHFWRNKMEMTEMEDVEEKLKFAFATCRMGTKFEEFIKNQ